MSMITSTPPNNNIVDKQMEKKLFDLTMGKKWEDISKWYCKEKWVRKAKLTKNQNTALHVAILSYNSSESTNTGKYIEEMIKHMTTKNLSTMNAKGDTPLHLAAAVGWTEICRYIMAEKDWELIKKRNKKNETPLFVAAHYGRKEAFICLRKIVDEKVPKEVGYSLCRRNDGNTALHSALFGESFDIANEIIDSYPNLVEDINLEGESPLHVLAKKPAIFKNVTGLRFLDSLICKYALVELHQGLDTITTDTDKDFGFPQNYRTCQYFPFLLDSTSRHHSRSSKYDKNILRNGPIDHLELWLDSAASTGPPKQHNAKDEESQLSEKEKESTEARSETDDHHSFPANYATLILLLKFAVNIILTIVGVGLGKIKKIEQRKEKYLQALNIIKKMLEDDSSYKYVNDGQEPVENTLTKLSSQRIQPPTEEPHDMGYNPKPEEKPQERRILAKADTPFIVAAKNGIADMVDIILNKLHIAIYDEDSKGRNVLMLAAKHRQMAVFDSLLKTKQIPERIFHHVDDEGNNIIHLAAMLEEGDKPWHIPGAALQMQWEMKWFAYVKNSVPSICFTHHINRKGETPGEIFAQKHKNLMQEGHNWLIKTSESCSVVAALIAGSAFGTSSSVPGGTNQETGRPVLEGEVAFDVFSISSLIGLCLAVTALVFFLAIITSRCVEKDFMYDLPSKLLSGLTCLFVSIVAMLVTYCAGHTFVLKDQLQFVEIPIYSIACVPVSLYAFAQLPLYADLVLAVCIKEPRHWV